MDSNKENQEQEEAPSELPSVASPRISGSVGASEGSSRPVDQFQHPPHYELTSGHDHLHWGGVGRRVGPQPHDTRSIASSAATRDDKSIYEEPGALDATEEGVERGDEEEEAEEIVLTQRELREAAPMQPEGSAADSAYTAISAGGSLAEDAGKAAADQTADVPIAEAPAIPESPVAAAAGVPESPVAATSGIPESPVAAAACFPQSPVAEPASSIPSDSPAAAPAEATGQAMAAAEAEPEPTPAEEDADGALPAAEGSARAADEQAEADAAAAVTDGSAADDALPASLSTEEASAAERDLVLSRLAAEPDDVADAVAAAEEEAAAAEQLAAPSAGTEQGGSPGGAPAPAAGPHFQSRLMQQLAASASEDDLAVYTADAEGMPQEAVRPSSPLEQPPALARPQPAQPEEPEAAPPPLPPSTMQPLSVEGVDARASEATAAMAAINASGGAAPQAQGGGDGEAAPQPGLLFPPSWYQTFSGLLYMDGVDALGRPVVVLNADAVPPNMKSSALIYVKAHLEPLVNQGEYVLVFTSRGVAKLPSMWIMGAYRSLPRPFRKNVQYVVLVRPSAFLRTVLAFMRPFVSKKAGRKIKQVDSVHHIAEATSGEVTVQSLGPAFAAEQLDATANSSPGGSP